MFREEYGINLLAKLKFYNLYLYKKEKTVIYLQALQRCWVSDSYPLQVHEKACKGLQGWAF